MPHSHTLYHVTYTFTDKDTCPHDKHKKKGTLDKEVVHVLSTEGTDKSSGDTTDRSEKNGEVDNITTSPRGDNGGHVIGIGRRDELSHM